MIKVPFQVEGIRIPQGPIIWLPFHSYRVRELKFKFAPGFKHPSFRGRPGRLFFLWFCSYRSTAGT